MAPEKRIVFLVGSYHPFYYANGGCVRNIVEELAGDFNITVITQGTRINQEDAIVGGARVVYAGTFADGIRKIASESENKSISILRSAARKGRHVYALLKRTSIDNSRVACFLEELKKLGGGIDAVVPTCLPFEFILAALEFKKHGVRGVKVVPLLIDTFSGNTTLHRNERNRRRKFEAHLSLERRMLEESDRVIAPDSWRGHMEEHFKGFSGRISYIQYPALKKPAAGGTSPFDSARFNVVYAGSVYSSIRPPSYPLKLFARLFERKNEILLHFFVRGDCVDIIDGHARGHPRNIVNHGSVPSDTAGQAMANADMLLSIGNADSTQFPSKIFEYVSTGRPVVHFYSVDDDPVLPILEKYKNSICVRTDDSETEENAARVLRFMQAPHEKIPFSEVEKEFRRASPAYAAKILREQFEN